MLTSEQQKAATRTASALEACDWSDVPLGQKMIVLNAINLLRAASAAPADGREPMSYVEWANQFCAEKGEVPNARDGWYAAKEFATAPTMSEAARDVMAERRRQVEVEGWTPESTGVS